MAVDILALNDPATITAIITTIIAAIFAAYERYQKNVTVDAMDPEKPQTEAQTKVIEKLPGTVWKMTEDTKESMWVWLRARGGEFTRRALNEVISQAEAELQVEYAVILLDSKGAIDMDVDHAFVSYGIPTYGKYAEIDAKTRIGASKKYTVYTYWYMLEDEKERLMQSIGYNNPVCITAAQKIIDDAEMAQTETYYIGCGNRTFKVYRGNVTEMGANPKQEIKSTK